MKHIPPAELHGREHSKHGADNTPDGHDCHIGKVHAHTCHDCHTGRHFASLDRMQKRKLLSASPIPQTPTKTGLWGFPPSLVLPFSPFDIQWYKDMHRNPTHNHAHSPSVPNDGSFFLHNRPAFLAYVRNLELTDSDASAGGGQNLLTIFVIFHTNPCTL